MPDHMYPPVESADRKATPITTGVLDYFPAALAEVARVSKAGNDKHNPGEPMHHARGKSTDHADSIARHLMQRGGVDEETGVRHSAELAWRALALLQQELEDEGLAPLARGARLVDGRDVYAVREELVQSNEMHDSNLNNAIMRIPLNGLTVNEFLSKADRIAGSDPFWYGKYGRIRWEIARLRS